MRTDTGAGGLAVLLLLAGNLHAAQVVIDGPPGSGAFGQSVTTLPNGNIVVTDPGFDAPGPIADVGAVYLYRPDGSLISTLQGSTANDAVGAIKVLANGNFLVWSRYWDNGAIVDAGAVTFVSGTSGISGVVSPANSLVGSSDFDLVGQPTFNLNVVALPNGNYVVVSPSWDNGAVVDAGAVTFGSGTSGVSGPVSAANSLVGSSESDRIGEVAYDVGVVAVGAGNYVVRSPFWDNHGVSNAGAVTFGSGNGGTVGAISAVNSLVGSSVEDRVGDRPWTILANGNYVVASPFWDNGTVANAGAATFGSGTSGVSGVISPANSLVGGAADDRIGNVTALANGNYVVWSQNWHNGAVADAGAATFASGVTGITGVVSPLNSLVGSSAQDRVGGATALANGNYVVTSPGWDSSTVVDAGAATFGSGTTGISGVVSAANSLVGSSASDEVGAYGAAALANGNYVVLSPGWGSGVVDDVGAATFGSGVNGISGVVSQANSLVGSTTSDGVGSRVTALANGNYVVVSSFWNSAAGAFDVGSVTFGLGTNGISGTVSAANSLVGTSTDDKVGDGGVIALTNGNYVVRSRYWDNGPIVDVGAVTFGLGTSGIAGSASASNSLVGISAGDGLAGSVAALTNGNYLVHSPLWDNGAVINAGAVTFGSGTVGISGWASTANSLVGSSAFDGVGTSEAAVLANGNYIIWSPFWANGAISSAGAVTLGLSDGSVTGPITSTQSVLGLVPNPFGGRVFSYDASRNQLAVGQPASNRVVLHRTGSATTTAIVSATPDPSRVGEPVSVSATVSASPAAPGDGKVSFSASTGESCVDTTPSPISPTTAGFSCVIAFATEGTSSVIAEYTGSVLHAYSGSTAQSHTTNPASLFGNGFETP